MAMTLSQGQRILGIQSGGGVCFGGSNMIFADCMCCDTSIMLRFDLATEVSAVSDAEARRIFEAAGWTISPTRCPEHAKTVRPNNGVQPTAELAGSQPIAAESDDVRQPAAADA
jgi:hypothetical protein